MKLKNLTLSILVISEVFINWVEKRSQKCSQKCSQIFLQNFNVTYYKVDSKRSIKVRTYVKVRVFYCFKMNETRFCINDIQC